MTSLCKTESTYQPNHSPPKWWLRNKSHFQRLCVIAKQHCASSATSVPTQTFPSAFLSPKHADMFSIRGSFMYNLFKLTFFQALKFSVTKLLCEKYLLQLDFSHPSGSKLYDTLICERDRKRKENSLIFIANRHQKVAEWASLCSDKYGCTLARPDYKQTLCTLLCSHFAWCLNGPWDHEKPPTWKPSSAHQGNSADT